MARRLVREGIRAVQQGEAPKAPRAQSGAPIPTYGQITVRRVPRAATREADRELLRETGRAVAAGHRLAAMQAAAS
jgi:hypothetical protein